MERTTSYSSSSSSSHPPPFLLLLLLLALPSSSITAIITNRNNNLQRDNLHHQRASSPPPLYLLLKSSALSKRLKVIFSPFSRMYFLQISSLGGRRLCQEEYVFFRSICRSKNLSEGGLLGGGKGVKSSPRCPRSSSPASDAANIRAQRFVGVPLRHNIWKMVARECKTLVKQVRPDWSTPINVCLNTLLIG